MRLTPPRPAPAPLTALRAFEAAARHGSFQRAAEELGVSAGAVAQQIKRLEDWAGVMLFERQAHGVQLTEEGARALPLLSQGFDLLGTAARTLRGAPSRAQIRIAALPAVAQLWLSPRLTALGRAVPDADISLHALDSCPDPARGVYDLGVYPGDGGGPVLAANSLIPVAAPVLAETIRQPGDLAQMPLIHDTAWRHDWQRWLGAHAITGVAADRGAMHSLYSIAVERCMGGDGVLIGHSALVAPLIEDGRLVNLFPDLAVPAAPLRLVLPPQAGLTALVSIAAKALQAA
ncbi:MAG: LysR family transcriptional regulator [Pseudomonadota bacterium]